MGKARCGVGAPQRALATFESTGRSEDVCVIGKRAFHELTDADKRERNYLVRDGSGFFLALNEYKTSAKFGPKQIKMDTYQKQ